jgi:hypothetical protein
MFGDADRRRIAEILRQSTAMLTSLGLGARFTLADLHQRVEQHRARPVHLLPRQLPTLAPHGLWVAGEHGDYVFYDCTAGPVRQYQIIGHEFGHMLFDDAATAAELTELLAMLAPDVDPALATNLRQRTSYEDLIERRAEVFGTVSLQRMDSWSHSPNPVAADPVVLARLIATLEGGYRRP